MKNFILDPDHQTIQVQAGTCFGALLEYLKQHNLTLNSYPTSAYTATVGGWIGTGGQIGIGTLQHGPFLNQVQWIKIITPHGELKKLENPEEFKKYFGSYGTLGIIITVCLVVSPISNEYPLLFGFNTSLACFNAITDLLTHADLANQISFIRVTDKDHENRCHAFTDFNYFLLIVLSNDNSETLNVILTIFNEWNGIPLDQTRGQQIWDEILRDEMKLKLNSPVQMMQQFLVDLSSCFILVDKFEKNIRNLKLTGDFSAIISKDHQVRLTFYTLTDNGFWNHFLASKALLHNLIKGIYQFNGRIYNYGLQNTCYFQQFERSQQKQFRSLKTTEDPKYILNPLKLTMCKISYSRIDIMFKLAILWRQLAIRFKLAKSPSSIRSEGK
jgi:glycolate oxidase